MVTAPSATATRPRPPATATAQRRRRPGRSGGPAREGRGHGRRPPGAATASGLRRAADLTGRILIGAGVILLLFTAYQIWGTSIQESHSQNQLRTPLRPGKTHRQRSAHALTRRARATRLPTGPPVTAPHTQARPRVNPVGRNPHPGHRAQPGRGRGDEHHRSAPRSGPLHRHPAAGPGWQRRHRRAPHHLRTPLLQPRRRAGPATPSSSPPCRASSSTTPFKQVVSPNDTAVIDNVFTNYLTLTTCNPRFSASTRLVVVAKLAHSELFPNSGLAAASALGHAPAEPRTWPGTAAYSLANAVIWGALVVLVGGVVLFLGRRFRRYGAGPSGSWARSVCSCCSTPSSAP